MADIYNIKGTVYDKNNAPAGNRTVYVYDRPTGDRIRTLTTNTLTGKFETRVPNQDEYFVVVMPEDGLDSSNAKIWDRVKPQPDHIETNVNKIGVPGAAGFGVGICPNLPLNFEMLDGYDDPTSPNYGNYRVDYDDSIMVWIPKFYFKWGDGTNGLAMNEIGIRDADYYANHAAAAVDGYVIHRAFIDGGVEQPGFFIDKYLNQKHPTLNCASSHYLGNALSAAPDSGVVYGINQLTGISTTTGGLIEAAKLRGPNFHIISGFMYNALYLLQYAHGMASSNTTHCAWYKPIANFPRGHTGNGAANTDQYDLSLVHFRGLKSNTWSLQGGYNEPAKTMHNGQLCGVCSMVSDLFNSAVGMFYSNQSPSAGWYYMSESFTMRNGTNDATEATGFFSKSAFSFLGPTIGGFTNNNRYYLKTGSRYYISEVNRNSYNYIATNLGLPNIGGTTTTKPSGDSGEFYFTSSYEHGLLCFGERRGIASLIITRSENINTDGSLALRSACYLPV